MIALLHADYRKLTHRWMPRVLIVILLAIVAIVFLAISARARFRGDLALPDGLVVALSLAAGFAAFIWPILAGSWSGGEYGWGTIRMVLIRRPSRIEFSLSGLIIVLLTVGLALILVLIVGAIAGSIVNAATGVAALPGPPGVSAAAVIIKLFFATWYTSAFYVLLAYTAGVIFRSTPAGIGLGIGFAVAQAAIAGIFSALGDPWATIALRFPDAYTTALTSRLSNELLFSGPMSHVSSTAASITTSIIALAIYFAVLLFLMLGTVARRDITA